jgi:hypothetical protein
MSLINCPECEKEVSSKALACPHCGAPIANDAESLGSGVKPKMEDKEKGPTDFSLWFILIAIVAVFSIAWIFDEAEESKAVSDFTYQACVDRGVQYYREIGSYPTLSSAPNEGRKAIDVARERCRRTTTAF